jgi:hypothetical protein
MTYEKPEVRDFGDIAEHTYLTDGDDGPGCSYEVCDTLVDAN